MSATGRRDLDDILDTIREVGETLERRSERGTGAIMMVWGAMCALTFAFYHVANAGCCLAGRFDHTLVHWAWVGPTLVGYALTATIGARLGRVRAKEGAANARRLMLVLLPPLAVLVAIIATGRGVGLIPALWVAFLAFTFLAWPGRTRRPTTPFLVAGVASALGAVALALPALRPWAWLAAAAWYALALGGLGAAKWAGKA